MRQLLSIGNQAFHTHKQFKLHIRTIRTLQFVHFKLLTIPTPTTYVSEVVTVCCPHVINMSFGCCCLFIYLFVCLFVCFRPPLQGCAFGFGFCASSHLDQVMIKLEQVMRDELTKKSKGFFSFVKVGPNSLFEPNVKCIYSGTSIKGHSE